MEAVLVVIVLVVLICVPSAVFLVRQRSSRGPVYCSACQAQEARCGTSLARACPVCHRADAVSGSLYKVCERCSARRSLCHHCGCKVTAENIATSS